MAPIAWNTRHSATNDDNPKPKSAAKLHMDNHELHTAWKKTYDDANLRDAQVSELKIMLSTLATCQRLKPEMQPLWELMGRALQCCVEVTALIKNTQIRCYYLQDTAHSMPVRSRSRKQLEARREGLLQIVQRLKRHFDDVVIGISAIVQMDARQMQSELGRLRRVPTEDVDFLCVRVNDVSNFLQLALHMIMQDEAVDPAPTAEERKLEMDFDDIELQLAVAKRLENQEDEPFRPRN